MNNETKYFDGQRAWEICDGDAELFHSLVGIFLETIDDMQDSVEAVLAGPASALEDAIHKLKGALRNLACVAAVALLQKAEDAARTGDAVQAAGLWKQTVPVLEKTSSFLAAGEWRVDFQKPLV